MSHELSFTERYNAMMGIALLRMGYLGEPGFYGGFEYSADAYKALGLEPPRDRFDRDTASLEGARCPRCGGACAVIGVEDVSGSKFAGTFAEDDPYTVAQGTLVCARDENHLLDAFRHDEDERDDEVRELLKVSVESTVGELVCLLDEIAREMGY